MIQVDTGESDPAVRNCSERDPETAGAPDSWRDSLADADTPGDLARLAGAATDRAAGVGGFANPRPGVA